jgi:PadR family transcriptional regulator, regulatory protein PadR
MSESLRGTFEVTLLATMATLPHGVSGLDLRRALAERTGRSPAVGAIYTALQRLEAKAFVMSRIDEPRAVRGGRARRLFTLTGAGAAALDAFRKRADIAWGTPSPELV